ncbi:MAG: FtsX-like permease family protein [Anaerolineae bacterium]|nr:FtsX-like permease family protein [Anaerolineae bacterium]MDQ7033628.1 FtsX-like permease family protein [Anaerolineae bacterium]
MLRPVIFRLGLRYISRRFFQCVLFIIGVALGVAVIIAIDIANGSASRAFDLSAQSISGRATHQISAGASGLPTELYAQIRLDLGIKLSAPIVSEFVRAEGVPQPLRLLGVDPLAEPPFRNYLTTVEVISEDDINTFEAITRFISEPNTILISQALADELNVKPGESITLNIGSERHTIRVIGLLRPEDRLSQQALDNLLLTDIATAQEITASVGRISRIDLILNDEANLDAIRDILPVNATLTSVQESGSALAQMTEAFEINLQALSLLAVIVGIFLIYNTVTFSVVQRRPVIGILRSLGATKDQIFAFIIGEAVILGLIGTVLGMGLGIIFGRFTVGIVSQTINDLYFSLTVNTVAVSPLSLLKGVFLGILASTGAAIVPSVEAMRTPPTGSMKRSSIEEKTITLVPTITGVALGFLVLGYLLLQIQTTSIVISFGALFFVIFGGALFTPIVLLLSMRLVTPVTNRLFGVLGRMAPRAIIRSLSRTSVAVAALTIAVSVIIGVSVMIGSFRNTIANWLENTLTADIYIAPPRLTANQAGTDVDPLLRDIIAAVEGVERVATNRTRLVTAPDYPNLPPINLVAVDFDLAGNARDYIWLNTDDANAALQDGQIMVSEPFAFRRDITRENHTLTLLTDSGEVTFDIAGVFYDYSTDQGSVLMNRVIYDLYWDDPYVTALAAFIAAGESVDTVVDRIEAQLTAYDVIVQSNLSLKNNVFEVFERTFTITVALRLLATLVAFIGILSALMSLQLEHTREYGVMRATGMTPSQLRLFTFIQTGLMGIVAGLLAIPIGLVLAMVLVYVINVRSFGWTMQFTIIYGEVAQALGVAIGAALLAGVYPALQLARINISQAIRSE